MKIVTSFSFAENVGGIHGENDVSQNEMGEDALVKHLYKNVYIEKNTGIKERQAGLEMGWVSKQSFVRW